MRVDLALLGELRVRIDGVDLPRLPAKSRALLATLALHGGEVVSVDTLIDELWPTISPDRARRIVQVRVAEVRKLLAVTPGGPLIEFIAPGYRLGIERTVVDANRFTDLLEDAALLTSVGDSLGATTRLREALGLWRGPALADAQPSVFLEAEAARMDELRLGAIEARVDAELGDGCHQRLVGELRTLVAAHPLRERLWAQLAVALYRAGRQTDALRACAAARDRLIEEVGLEPGPTLRAVEVAILAQDPALTWQPGSPSARAIIPDPFDRSSTGGGPVSPPPPVHYVKTPSGVNVAYQVAGEGPIDLVIVPGFISELDNWWEAWSGRLVRRLASFARLILFDKRGTGLSDRPERITVDDWIEDIGAVLDAVGAVRPVVLGMSAGCPIALLFAAIHPNRTGPLVLYAGTPRLLGDGTDYPATGTAQDLESRIDTIVAGWGSGDAISRFCPSVSDDASIRAQFGQYERRSASPGSAAACLRLTGYIDVRAVLPLITAPTLVLHPARDQLLPGGIGRYIAGRIADATLCVLDTEDHLIWYSEKVDDITDEVERFVTRQGPLALVDHSLITVVVALVDGCRHEELHNHWQLLAGHHGGRAVERADHLISAFDGPSRALDFAAAAVAHLISVGASPRVAVHAGHDNPDAGRGPGVVTDEGVRLASTARPGEVLSSPIVRDLVGRHPSPH